ncbi:hypothetical protein ACFPOI_05665 [Nonomuraea angiospora]|uniref:Uncharacterized protein n=2 Tax=Nonomuraea TaxID=83681 RepID=A0A7W9LBF7_9ACTN|nr:MULTISPECIES: hypothetical protein [Nonomuraea]MBB5777611.1 hypothetical protein [Nonomuraea jabiensis]MBE1590503.1 hypothetical protein [Nonomuraea angiospora]MDX3106373.1 hypothetical protein [Nonomuraea angiospora]
MKKIAAVAGLVVMATSGVTAAFGDGTAQHEVSQQQYDTLISQCRYADQGKAKCREAVKEMYRIGKYDKTLDCRTYSGVTVCGTLKLSKAERQCVRESVSAGLTYRRAEVECYAFT